MERNLIHVKYVQSLSAEVQSWFSIKESILRKNPSNDMNMGKPLVRAQSLIYIRELQWRETLYMWSVCRVFQPKYSPDSASKNPYWGETLQMSWMWESFSQSSNLLRHRKKHAGEKNSIHVVRESKHLLRNFSLREKAHGYTPSI